MAVEIRLAAHSFRSRDALPVVASLRPRAVAIVEALRELAAGLALAESDLAGLAGAAVLVADAHHGAFPVAALVAGEALLAALRSNAIAGAGIDVFDEEPLPPDSPWRHLDNATLTTHFGGDTEDTNRTSARLVADAVLEFARTGRVARAVNAAELGW